MAQDATEDQISWFIDLCKRNVAHFQEDVWKWSDKKKLVQMKAKASRFLVVQELTHPPNEVMPRCGYVNFRFENYEGEATAYCYEIHLEKSARQIGLGTHLMTCLEHAARRANMDKITLTVFTENENAVRFYRRLGFDLDDTSLTRSLDPPFGHECGYHILSKSLNEKTAIALEKKRGGAGEEGGEGTEGEHVGCREKMKEGPGKGEEEELVGRKKMKREAMDRILAVLKDL
eukprot:CAMPEP_0175076874 /NCGR_PEP_ID=MMETSP0052_2-20121109/23017_1 /TAXON_ID=51329 ORGANISM="Polytomella parva, Strain SAG 63-3" /NCGR_SAMPLE_ID=MMETSP0052_2 /ASSEMBLY_ACC=CAM_ASM_000194 /LENGTH=231 /DNA_ID=CAMNT_0016346157 /DNA_START=159 /DNA_END=854 /DNA_ORIENTATION=-